MKRQTESDRPLRGMRILVADDEFLVSCALEYSLNEAGAETFSAATLAQALERAEDNSISIAVLDFRLGRKTTEPVADRLSDRGVAFVFYSGQTLPDHLRHKFPLTPFLTKPTRHEVLVDVLKATVGR